MIEIERLETLQLGWPADRAQSDIIVLILTTARGRLNFCLERAQFAQIVRAWAFDLEALDGAIASGAPLPGQRPGQISKPPT